MESRITLFLAGVTSGLKELFQSWPGDCLNLLLLLATAFIFRIRSLFLVFT